MILIGVDDKGDAYTVRGFNGGGKVTTIGHDIARMKLVKIVDPQPKSATLLSDFAFALAVAGATFLLLFGARQMLADLFLFTWNAFAGR